MLRSLVAQGLAVALVMHDLTLAARFCDELVPLEDRRVLAAGTPAQVLTDAHLASAFGIQARYVEMAGEAVLVPWQTMAEPNAETAARAVGQVAYGTTPSADCWYLRA